MKENSTPNKIHIGFITSSSIIFAGSFLVNVLNYVFTLIISRLLGVEAFGEVTALFSLMLVVSVPASALTMLMTREAAFRGSKGLDGVRDLFVFLKRHVFVASAGFWILFLICVPLLSRFLQIDTIPLFIFSALIPVTLASSLQTGTLQGLQEFFMLSKQSVLSTVIKLLVSILLVKAGFSVIGVMLGLLLATACSWGYGYFATRTILKHESVAVTADNSFSLRSIQSLFSTILVTTLLLVLLSNIDVLMAKHFLAPDIAGQYGALSTLGKILIYGIGAFITVLLPMASAAEAEGVGKGSRILGFSLAIITAVSVATYLAFLLFPHLIITILFGARYIAVEPYLATFSIAMGCISLSTALINYFIAIKNTTFIYLLLVGIIVEISLITLNHTTLAAITLMLVLSSVFLLILMSVNYALFCRQKSIQPLPSA